MPPETGEAHTHLTCTEQNTRALFPHAKRTTFFFYVGCNTTVRYLSTAGGAGRLRGGGTVAIDAHDRTPGHARSYLGRGEDTQGSPCNRLHTKLECTQSACVSGGCATWDGLCKTEHRQLSFFVGYPPRCLPAPTNAFRSCRVDLCPVLLWEETLNNVDHRVSWTTILLCPCFPLHPAHVASVFHSGGHPVGS